MSLTQWSCDDLRSEAISAAGGLTDFGGRAHEDGLHRLLTAVQTTGDRLLPAGRDAARGMIVEALVNRLWLRENERRNPAIAQMPIDKPIFVLGLPRSGTTLLHNLLALHPQLTAPTYWELRHPVTPRGLSTAELVDDVDASLTALYRSAPMLRSIHAQAAQSPDECTWLLANELASMVFTFAFDIPDYLDWLLSTNLTDAFSGHRRQLQHIRWRRPGATLVLKDPYHALYLDELNTVYPDARYIYLHRSPADVLSSLCSLRETVRHMHYRHDEPAGHGQEVLALVKRLLLRQQAFRREHPMSSRVLDIDYAALVADPHGTAEEAFAFLGIDKSDAGLAERLMAYLTRNPQNQFGVHRHSLDRFSLDETQLNTELSGLTGHHCGHGPPCRPQAPGTGTAVLDTATS
ncbi:sulfotransferase family protein [Nocardia tengchongensis]|uniref:sulfotransferase family protein n=1 Tax=Nocardia tengchongensis TaxID=2055889 RepID=UPI0036C6FACE